MIEGVAEIRVFNRFLSFPFLCLSGSREGNLEPGLRRGQVRPPDSACAVKTLLHAGTTFPEALAWRDAATAGGRNCQFFDGYTATE